MDELMREWKALVWFMWGWGLILGGILGIALGWAWCSDALITMLSCK